MGGQRFAPTNPPKEIDSSLKTSRVCIALPSSPAGPSNSQYKLIQQLNRCRPQIDTAIQTDTYVEPYDHMKGQIFPGEKWTHRLSRRFTFSMAASTGTFTDSLNINRKLAFRSLPMTELSNRKLLSHPFPLPPPLCS